MSLIISILGLLGAFAVGYVMGWEKRDKEKYK